MEITRRANILNTNVRRSVISFSLMSGSIVCPICGGAMIPAQHAAVQMNVSSREIYRLIEADAIHFVETDNLEIYVCSA